MLVYKKFTRSGEGIQREHKYALLRNRLNLNKVVCEALLY